MSEPIDPKRGSDPDAMPVDDDDLQFESDALLDTLLADPFPIGPPAKPAPPPPPKASPSLGKSNAERGFTAQPPTPARHLGGGDYSGDEVTVVGQGIDELLAQSFSESGPPGPLPAAGQPPPVPAPPRPLAPPRPAPLPPRPHGTNEPILPARPATPPGNPPPAISTQLPKTQVRGDYDDEETRVLRLPSNIAQLALPSSPPPPPAGNEGKTIRAPELGASSAETAEPRAASDSESGDAPTRPPEGKGAEARVPPAPRVPTLLSAFEPESQPAKALTSSAPPSARPTPRPDLPLDSIALSSAPPPSLATTGGPIDPIAREAWISRAEWLELEAESAGDPQAKARTLLVASEIWALIGDIGRAREVVTEASAIARSMSMVARQQRWLAAVEADWKSVASLLEVETRSAATPEARLHAAYLCAEVHRLQLDDREAARKKFDLCARAQVEDPRAHVMRLIEQLAATNAPPKLRLPDAAELAELSNAVDELTEVRTPNPAGNTPLAALEEARRALIAGDRNAAALAVLRLGQLPGLLASARWLAAALYAPDPERRGQAIELIERLIADGAGPSARRALAARSLEADRPEALAVALNSDPPVFAAADRLALSALAGGADAHSEALLSELQSDPAKAALASGVILSGHFPSASEPRLESAQTDALLALGRTLARPPAARSEGLGFLQATLDRLREQHPEHPLGRVLGVELALDRADTSEIAARLSDWPRAESGRGPSRDGQIASALVHELSGQAERARPVYERVLAATPNSEFATRALIAQSEPEEGVVLVEQLAEAEGSGTAAALHFIEAALRRGSIDPTAQDALLEKAAQADPRLMLTHRLGVDVARQSENQERQLSWLRLRRAAATDSLEAAIDLVVEATLLASSNREAALTLLKEASELRPNDVALLERAERLEASPEQGRASWREAVAERHVGATRERLLLEAARAHENDGDREAAIAALRGLGEGPGRLAAVMRERLAPTTSEATAVAEALSARAKDNDEPNEQRELFGRLYELDRARGAEAAALEWQRAIFERSPAELATLRRLESAYMAADRKQDLEAVEGALSKVLSGTDLVAPARLAMRLRLLRGDWAGTRSLAELALTADPNSLWALRMLSAQARAADEPEVLLDSERKLCDLASHPLDKATLALRAAEAAARLERWDDARLLLDRALEHVPDHMVALTTLAAVMEAREEHTAAARAWEAVAEASQVDAHRVNALCHAAALWLDKAHDPEQGRLALEQAVMLDLGHDEAVSRLQSIYVARGDRQKLADLLARRLERTTDPEERIAIEVTRGRALAEVGEPALARAALAAALDANPDHLEALEAFAEVCLTEGDWGGAEQAFIRLARHSADPARQAQIYRRLAELYDTSIPNLERAELAYQEVLKREPDDATSVERLVTVYGRLGAPTRAIAAQSQLLERATTPEQRRERTLRLATVYDQIAGQPKQAEVVLERARKEWPYDASMLRALVELQQRLGETRAANMLLDRATADSRRALGTGRFEPGLFEILAAVADLRGAVDSAAVAHSTLAALLGDELGLRGGGPAAGSAALDEVLAPDLLSPPLRALLRRTGDILDTAYPFDVRNLRATPLPPGAAGYEAHVQDMARAFGFPSVQVLVSPVIGSVCVPASSTPPLLIFGQTLLESSDDAARYCLLMRALKVLQGRAATVARTAPIDLWPVVAGLLCVLAPSFTPQAIDAKKLAEAKSRIQAVLPAQIEDDTATLALEVSSLIGNRASQLATQVYMWGNRTALLAAGSLASAFRSIALGAPGGGTPPAGGSERIKWIVRNAEARDLAIFSVSEPYAEARRRVRVAEV
jgi:lipoprotein NlpI